MSYDVIRHADTKRREVIKFMKVIPGAVYFKSVNGNLQVVSSFRDSLDSEHANGRDIYNHLRKDTVGHGYKITTDELLKAARAYIDQFSSVKHSDDDPDVLTEDEIEIIDAPYPKDPQMPRGNAAMRPFDYEDTGVYPRDYTEGSLQHHGVKGMRWGVINEDDPKGRSRSSSSGSNSGGSSRGSQSSGGHPYYSPSVGDASSHHSVKKDKSGVSGPTNTSVSNSKERTTPDFSNGTYSDSTGVHFPVKIGNTMRGVEFGLNSAVITSALDRGDKNLAGIIKTNVISQLNSFQRNGIKIYLTDKQIDMVVWQLMYEVNNWKKNYYKPGVYHSNFMAIREGDEYLEHHGILGQKWGVRRYQNADGSLTEAGRKRYNVQGVRKQLENAQSDREKRTILAKAENKAALGQMAGMLGGMGALAAKSAAKETVAYAAKQAAIQSVASQIGTNVSVHTAFAASVPGWATLLATPVGQIALGAAAVAGAGMTVYNLYKAVKLSELATEFDVSTTVNRSINAATNQGIFDNKVDRMRTALDNKDMKTYNEIKNSFSSDEEKDRAEKEAEQLRRK